MPTTRCGNSGCGSHRLRDQRAFRQAESFFIDRDRIDLETVRQLLQKGSFLVADERGSFARLRLRRNQEAIGPTWACCRSIPQHQKSGLGSQLMTAAEEYCAKAGCRFMDLRIVSVRKELPRFYHRRGYVETGTAPFPAGLNPKLPCHFVKMSKPLT